MTRRLVCVAFLLAASFVLPSDRTAVAAKQPRSGGARRTQKRIEPKPAGSPIAEALRRPLLEPLIPLQEVQDYIDARIPNFPDVRKADEWRKYADNARRLVLDRVVFRGEAAGWRNLPTRTEWLETIDGGPGYKIKKLRYEAVPGLWVPALLYEPTTFREDKVPVSLAVNGHESPGKSIEYKQLRCINQAKRGMIVLNAEYLGMGQLTGPNYAHYRMNQLDLCGTSGLAPFYLVMSRGLDILLAHEHADPARVAVQGLSGGGWQTITISAFDPRVTLCNPVAGYSSLRTRVRNVSDLGDSEQNPVDLETIVDYAQMTAMLAPRPAPLTYNMTDTCCFRADHALPPLADGARPIYELLGKPQNLRQHVNQVPGDHNYGLDNRQQFYALLHDFFFAGRRDVPIAEIPSDGEIKTAQQLDVELPRKNADFNSLARQLSAALPKDAAWPEKPGEILAWQTDKRERLRKIVAARTLELTPVAVASRKPENHREQDWWLRIGGAWTVPAVELGPKSANETTILIGDQGRAAASNEVDQLLKQGKRVLAVDLFYFGESKIPQRDALFAIAVSSVGERPLGIQAGQLQAIARWLRARDGRSPQVVAAGPRSSLIALVAAALDSNGIGALQLHHSLGSLKEVIEQNQTVEQAPELFCFGLLEHFDVRTLVALVAPRPVRFEQPGDRVKAEMGAVPRLYHSLGVRLNPLD